MCWLRHAGRSLLLLITVLFISATPVRTADPPAIQPTDLREWLGYIASDELQGRQVFTEGLGLAAGYIADHLASWHVRPGGEDGTYFQTVKVLGVRTTSRSSVTVEVNGQRRTFRDGEGVVFPKRMGSRQTLTLDRVQFAGGGLQIPAAGVDDYAGLDPSGALVIFMGRGPDLPGNSFRLQNARSRNALARGALATIGPGSESSSGRPARDAAPGSDAAAAASDGSHGPQGRRNTLPDNGDFTTTERLDAPIAPALTATDEFYEFLLSGAPVKYAELKEKAAKRDPLPRFPLPRVRVTIEVDADYTVVRTRLTRNVVGIIQGTDARLRDTYVALGAHYDHIGYAESGGGGSRSVALFGGSCPGQARDTPRADDVVNNGADDDGSGTVAVMALARAFALGPKPKRSLLFVWHTGEEAGLYGSKFYADHPLVPPDRTAAQLNIDMVGRNRCDDPAQENTVYLVGADRISTELHNLNEAANADLPRPLALDYELNDPADPESIYTRSDHYSYAAKGIPIIFYTTGLHRDYHYVTDEVSKIDFPKLARVTELVYATAMRVANLDHLPARDNRGPRTGRGRGGRIAD